MTTDEHVGCVQSAAGPVRSEAPAGATATAEKPEEASMMQARVGHEAPDFEATAFLDGGFQNVKLSDYNGQWVVLCFYPGDFTFV